ncbi:hypothetical protein [Dyadobacter sp. CY312]|uniref:hypothetical protein n=1 Tax=Dyadobacter sp. CY312 TaxID=2907303 RepID=UPI001F3B7656|nr:hypothetical protein [Dyadobacter sp. CY312]MCE7044663.1 hypothetical protein [Dyadobacter sp. CY312]
MKNVFLLALLLTSGTRLVPLKNQYDEQVKVAVINKPLQEIWDRFALLALDNGYPVKSIDHKTGLVTVDQTSFDGHGGFESKDGRVPNQQAYIVAERFSDEYPDHTDEYTFVANWNLLITAIDSNTTQLRIKLYDTAAYSDDVFLKGNRRGNLKAGYWRNLERRASNRT